MSNKILSTRSPVHHAAMQALLVLALLSSACTPILDADFDTFVPGDPAPNGPLPGNPAGDSLVTSGVVTVTGPQWLNFIYAPGVTLPSYAEFHVGGLPHNTSNYYITFVGHRFDTGSTPAVVNFRGANGLLAARLRVVNGEIQLYSGLGWETLGSHETQISHNFWVRLDQLNQEVSVSVAQTGLATLSVTGRPYASLGFDELERMEVALAVAGSPEASQYFLDDLLIERQNPPEEEAELTRLLDQWTDGDERALDRLIPLAWDRFRRREGSSLETSMSSLEELKRFVLEGNPELVAPDEALSTLSGLGGPDGAP